MSGNESQFCSSSATTSGRFSTVFKCPRWTQLKWNASSSDIMLEGGASEAAVLLGHDPYGKTPFKLWQLKLGLDTKSGGPEALFQRGHETETMVRAAYEFETGLDFGPACFEHSEFPFIRASLDGWNDAEKRGIEIKMVGKEAIKLPPPLHHLIQVQHQMLVTGTSSWVYIRHCEGETKVEVIQEDLTMQRDILAACGQLKSESVKERASARMAAEKLADVQSGQLARMPH